MIENISELLREWYWVGFLVIIAYQARRLDNEELEANLSIERGFESGMSEGVLTIRTLNSIDKYLKFGVWLLLLILVMSAVILHEIKN